MRILFYSPHPELPLNLDAGPGIHMREVIRAMREAGHEVKTVIMGDEQQATISPLDNDKDSEEVKSAFKKFTPPLLWQTAKDYKLLREDERGYDHLKAAIQQWKPDFIYERGYYLMTSGVRAASEFGLKHMLEMNAPYPEERMSMEGKSIYGNKALAAEQLQIESTDRIIAVSSALKEYVTKRLQSAAEKTVITPNAIRPEQFDRHPFRRNHIRHARGFSEDHMVVGFVGSIFPYHGVDILVNALAELAPDFPELRGLIVGNGQILQQLYDLAEKRGVKDQIVWTGSMSRHFIADHISAMDITVMARSNWYGSPVKIFEYGALGKAVIAPDVTPVRDVMTHEKHGLLIEPSVSALTAALRRLLADQPLRQRLGKEWQVKVREQHTWKQVVADSLAGF